MIRRLLARFGYYPVDVVDDAWDAGRRRGEQETRDYAESMICTTRMKYNDLQIHHNHLLRLIADRQALMPRTTFIIKGDPKNGLH